MVVTVVMAVVVWGPSRWQQASVVVVVVVTVLLFQWWLRIVSCIILASSLSDLGGLSTTREVNQHLDLGVITNLATVRLNF